MSVSPAALYAPEIYLTTEVCAGMVGRSKWTLVRARHDRFDLDMPPWVYVGKRSVRYPLSLLFEWARRRRERLDWTGVPVSFALPAFDAYAAQGKAVPPTLAEAVERVRAKMIPSRP